MVEDNKEMEGHTQRRVRVTQTTTRQKEITSFQLEHFSKHGAIMPRVGVGPVRIGTIQCDPSEATKTCNVNNACLCCEGCAYDNAPFKWRCINGYCEECCRYFMDTDTHTVCKGRFSMSNRMHNSINTRVRVQGVKPDWCEREDLVSIEGTEEDENSDEEESDDYSSNDREEQMWNSIRTKAEMSDDIEKHMALFGQMNNGAKIAQLAVSQGLRSMFEDSEAELVIVVPSTSELWMVQPTNTTTGVMAVSRPYVSSLPSRRTTNSLLVKEARSNDDVIDRAVRFRKQRIYGTNKVRTTAPIITREMAMENGYIALFTIIEAIVWTMTGGTGDTNGHAGVLEIIAATEEVEGVFRGCYIAMRGELGNKQLKWRARVNTVLYDRAEGDSLKLKECAGEAADWLLKMENQQQERGRLENNADGAQENSLTGQREDSESGESGHESGHSTPRLFQEVTDVSWSDSDQEVTQTTKYKEQVNIEELSEERTPTLDRTNQGRRTDVIVLSSDSETESEGELVDEEIYQKRIQERKKSKSKETKSQLTPVVTQLSTPSRDLLNETESRHETRMKNFDTWENEKELESRYDYSQGTKLYTPGAEGEYTGEILAMPTVERDNYDCPDYADNRQLYEEHQKLLKEFEGTVNKLAATRQVHIQQCVTNEVLNDQLSASKETVMDINKEFSASKIRTGQCERELAVMTQLLNQVSKAADTATHKKKAARSRNKELNNQLEEMEKESDSLNDQLEEKDRLLEALEESQAVKDNGQIEEGLQDKLTEMTNEVKKLELMCKTPKGEWKHSEESNQEEVENLKQEVNELTVTNEELASQLKRVRSKAKKAAGQRETVQVELDNKTTAHDGALLELSRLRDNTDANLEKKNKVLEEKLAKSLDKTDREAEATAKEKSKNKTIMKDNRAQLEKERKEIVLEREAHNKRMAIKEQEILLAEDMLTVIAVSDTSSDDQKRIVELMQILQDKEGEAEEESCIVYGLRWFEAERMMQLNSQNELLRARIRSQAADKSYVLAGLTHSPTEQSEIWDYTVKLAIGPRIHDMAENAQENIQQLEEETKKTLFEMNQQMIQNTTAVRFFRGQVNMQNSTRTEFVTTLKRAQDEAEIMVKTDKKAKKGKKAYKEQPSKLAELCLIKSNNLMRTLATQVESTLIHVTAERIENARISSLMNVHSEQADDTNIATPFSMDAYNKELEEIKEQLVEARQTLEDLKLVQNDEDMVNNKHLKSQLANATTALTEERAIVRNLKKIQQSANVARCEDTHTASKCSNCMNEQAEICKRCLQKSKDEIASSVHSLESINQDEKELESKVKMLQQEVESSKKAEREADAQKAKHQSDNEDAQKEATRAAERESNLRRELDKVKWQTPPDIKWLSRNTTRSDTVYAVRTDIKQQGCECSTICIRHLKSDRMERFQAEDRNTLMTKFMSWLKEEGLNISTDSDVAVATGDTTKDVREEWINKTNVMGVWEVELNETVSMTIETGDSIRPTRNVQGIVTWFESQSMSNQFIITSEFAKIKVGRRIYKVDHIESFDKVHLPETNAGRKDARRVDFEKGTHDTHPRDASNNSTDDNSSNDDSDDQHQDWTKDRSSSRNSGTDRHRVGVGRDSPRDRSRSKSESQSGASQPDLKSHARLMKKTRELKIKDNLKKVDPRTEKGKLEFKEIWKQVASQDLMYDTTQAPWALASMLQSIGSEGQLLLEVVAEKVEEDPQVEGCFRFIKEMDTSTAGWRKKLCTFIYHAVTDLVWEDRGKESNRKLWKAIRENGEVRLLKIYLKQVKADLLEEAAFNDTKRYQKAVTDVCKELGWETHPDIIKAMNNIRDLFDDHEHPEERANAFEEEMLQVYGGVLKQHKRVVQLAFSRPEDIDGTFGSAVKWLTKEYIGEEMYTKVPLKYRQEWEGSESTTRTRSQRADKYGRRYDANRTETVDGDEDALCQSDEEAPHKERDETPDYIRTALKTAKVAKSCWDVYVLEAEQEERAAEEHGFASLMCDADYTKAYLRTVVKLVETEMPGKKRTFFGTERLDNRIRAKSEGHRGLDRVDPSSQESVKWCNEEGGSREELSQICEDKQSREYKEHEEEMFKVCEEHPENKYKHGNFECCSPFHRLRNSPLMLISSKEKEDEWANNEDATGEQRRESREEMVKKSIKRKNERKFYPRR